MSTKRSTYYSLSEDLEKNDISSFQSLRRRKPFYILIILSTLFLISLIFDVNILSSTVCNSCELTQETENIVKLSQEKYLTYLPHSGLHNQRVELENAIFMAWSLNRTLILPPLILGKRFPYRQFDRLEQSLSYLSKVKQKEICKSKTCEAFTFYRWDKLFDFTFILKNVKIIHREDLIPENLFSKLNITNDNDNEQVWRLAGNHHINSFYEHKTSEHPNHISIMDLRQRNEKLLYFNSLFGQRVIKCEFPQSIKFMRELQDTFIIIHPTLLDITKKISDKLGGQMKYLSAHARIGDGYFKGTSEAGIEDLIKNIDTYLNAKSFQSNNHTECKQDEIIYLASDAPSKDDETLRPIFEKFPCTFMLEDFKDLMTQMDELINERDGLKLKKFLIPILDLMVGANGKRVITMNNTTFGKYLSRYHEYLKETKETINKS